MRERRGRCPKGIREVHRWLEGEDCGAGRMGTSCPRYCVSVPSTLFFFFFIYWTGLGEDDPASCRASWILDLGNEDQRGVTSMEAPSWMLIVAMPQKS
jgi:hypothetical protein